MCCYFLLIRDGRVWLQMHDSHATYFCVPEAILMKIASLKTLAVHSSSVAALKLTFTSSEVFLFCKQFHSFLHKNSTCQTHECLIPIQCVLGPELQCFTILGY